jgi:hypothetical protein
MANKPKRKMIRFEFFKRGKGYKDVFEKIAAK